MKACTRSTPAAVVLLAAGIFPAGAAEYSGAVKCAGLPVPGAIVTAANGGAKAVTSTDERGSFLLRDLAEGTWTVTVGMTGFETVVRQVRIEAANAASVWELEFVPLEMPAAPAERAAPRPETFRRSELAQQNTAVPPIPDGFAETTDMAALTQSAANSFIVQGSVSSAAGLPQQNDWPLGPRGPGMEGMGPLGMMPPVGLGPGVGGAPGGDGPGAPPAGPGPGLAGRGPGGPGGFGAIGGLGGRGGFGGPGRPGGPGGPGPARGRGGPDRPAWQGRPNAVAFGNARRASRPNYMAGAFFSLGNSVWDARSYSVTGAAVDKPSYANARAGIMLGGPLYIPKLVSPARQIFFMFNYHVQRNRTGVISEPVNMPTALERGGDFSRTAVQGAPFVIYDPASGLPFAGNRIPASRISGAAAGLLGFFPDPNLPFAARNYQTSWSGSNNSQMVNSRVANLKIGSKDRLNGGIGYQGGDSVTPNLFHFVDSGATRGIHASAGWSRNITPRVINNVQYVFSRNRQQTSPYFANVRNVAAEFGIAGTSQAAVNWGPPTLTFTNYAALTAGNYALNRNQTGAVIESVTWVRGDHTASFGGSYRRQQFNAIADANGRGTYSFNGWATSALAGAVAAAGTGYDLADFLLGFPAAGSIRYGSPDKYLRGAGYDLFVNDDWRLHPRFSVNVGVRWDYATPSTERYGRLTNLDLRPDFAAASAYLAGQAAAYSGVRTDALIRPDRNNFSPRFGFAWRPRAGSMVVRGGYGVYYNTSVYNLIANHMAQQPPFSRVLNLSSSAANPLRLEDGFLLASTQPAAVTYAIDPGYRIGYAQTWNLSVQNDLPFGMFATAGYLGTKGTRLDQQFLPNSTPPGAAESPYPRGFIYQASNGNSIYHAAQFQLNRRFRSGFLAHGSYQFSKSIDNAGTGGRGQGGTPIAQNWLDLAAERGLSDFDARHNLSVNFQYSTGMGIRGGALVASRRGALLKDWTIGGSIALRSGNPFTATVGGNRSQVSGAAVGNLVRADATGLPVSVPGMLFNTAAFSQPPAGEWGNAGRNTIPGPSTFFLNASLGRTIRLGERRSADLQLQAQNVLNHVAITRWGNVVGANNYGLAAGAAEMRRLTATLRFRF